MELDTVRYVLRLTWRWRSDQRPDDRSVAGLAVLLRFLGFRVDVMCQGDDHASYRLRPRGPSGLPLGRALARIATWEDESLGDYPGTTWDVSVELPCPRQSVPLEALPAVAGLRDRLGAAV